MFHRMFHVDDFVDDFYLSLTKIYVVTLKNDIAKTA